MDKMMWAKIPGMVYYQASNTGLLRSTCHKIVRNNGRRQTIRGKVLSTHLDRNGYLHAKVDGKDVLVHRMVALAFIPNPHNLPEINHKNEIKDDNRVDNLEWCDRKYNLAYGTFRKRQAKSLQNRVDLSKPVEQIGNNGTIIATFPSIMEAERKTGIPNQNIGKACSGKYCKAGGYCWRYV